MMKAKQKFRKVKLVKLASDEMDGWTMSIVHIDMASWAHI